MVEGENYGKHEESKTIEEIVGECETDLRSEEGLVDGTCSRVVIVECRGSDTITQEKG